ncbi:copper-transporting ATPase [Aliidongia dinghuensis]|uniref:Copper-transporting ATPase n=1 Tax=Aliidongia dinghuensis TaxID=1867774 RepID=A0A8J2Z0Y2_9PROT|nr:cation-translocating P-type ATPase [Aliidongia dinghuensis]GGF45933.1 copper-transporting ATPase [Aliidongia dinghuensis]
MTVTATPTAAPLRLAITGMTCASCAGRVERALKRVPGVESVTVNLATEEALVSAAAPTDALIAAVVKAGYGAAPRADSVAAPAGPQALPVILACLFTAPLLLPMLLQPFGITLMLPIPLGIALAAPVQLWFGRHFYRAAWAALRSGDGNMDQLVVLGSSAAWVLSLYNLATAPAGATPELYLEPAAAIVAFVLLGKHLEARAKRHTRDAVTALAALRPSTASVIEDGREVERPVEALRLGDLIRVRPGERLPADGIVRDGRAGLDEAVLTGESHPVERGPGDTVVAGALALDGALTIEVTALGRQSALGRILAQVEAAEATKAPVQRLVDRVSRVFVPAVLVIGLATMLGWALAGAAPSIAVLRGVAVWVIACPCALGLATPAALVAAFGSAARRGILLKDPAALEAAHRIDLVAFDKTGTLTEGKPVLTEILAADGDAATALRRAAALQDGSEHPLGQALVAALGERGLAAPEIGNFRALPGIGVAAEIDGEAYAVGTARLLEGAPPAVLAEAAARLEADGRTLSWLVRQSDRAPLALFGFTDQVRAQAASAVARLRAMRVEVALLTGDTAGSAAAAARAVGIDEVRARLLPADKTAAIADWQRQGRAIAMVGDGINDAPALAQATLGIAVDAGTDVAVAAAGASIRGGDPARVADLLALSRASWAVIRQNLGWAFGFNVIGIPLAAAGLLSPTLAAAAMACSSVAVVTNALRLARWRPRA